MKDMNNKSASDEEKIAKEIYASINKGLSNNVKLNIKRLMALTIVLAQREVNYRAALEFYASNLEEWKKSKRYGGNETLQKVMDDGGVCAREALDV